MILDEVVLQDFGAYQGRQTVRLTPPSPDRPVVLFGGLNGAGKTTFVDALQLALFGKQARCSNRGSASYEEYLRNCIHRNVPSHLGAAVEIQFRHRTDGDEHTYRVRRDWRVEKDKVKEYVEVLHNGQLDRVLTDAWSEHVEEFIPFRIAHLFFFDGEKIEGFADLENSAQLLSTAVHSLLGLDLVDRLTADLTTLERQKQVALKKDSDRKHIDEVQARIEQLEQKREALVQERASANNHVDQSKIELGKLEESFREAGGTLYERRHEIEQKQKEVGKNLQKLETDLREFASGVAPLLLIPSLLQSLSQQVAAEDQAEQSELLSNLLEERDQHLVTTLQTNGLDPEVIRTVAQLLLSDRQNRGQATDLDQFLSLDSDEREQLQALEQLVLPDARRQIRGKVEAFDGQVRKLLDLDRMMAGLPDERSLSDIKKKRQEALLAQEKAERQTQLIGDEIDQVNREIDAKHTSMVNLLEEGISKNLENQDTVRMVQYSGRVRDKLSQFRRSLLERHVSRIEGLILDSLRLLLRKQSLVSELKIDPETFQLELRTADGQILMPDRMSAGERQLLAVAILWGLTRASGRPLPAVIDTPMGRLDSKHRSHLVERYFPQASHQVLLLSTDEEIDDGFFEQIKPYIGHSYRLEFDDATGGTRVAPGYFW